MTDESTANIDKSNGTGMQMSMPSMKTEHSDHPQQIDGHYQTPHHLQSQQQQSQMTSSDQYLHPHASHAETQHQIHQYPYSQGLGSQGQQHHPHSHQSYSLQMHDYDTKDFREGKEGKYDRTCPSVLKGEPCWALSKGKKCHYASHQLPDQLTHVYVCHLPSTYTKVELDNLFKQFGPISESKILTDPKSGKSRCVGFVHFENSEHAKAAIQAVDKMRLPDHQLPLVAKFARLSSKKKKEDKEEARERRKEREAARRERRKAGGGGGTRYRSPPHYREGGSRGDDDRYREGSGRGRGPSGRGGDRYPYDDDYDDKYRRGGYDYDTDEYGADRNRGVRSTRPHPYPRPRFEDERFYEDYDRERRGLDYGRGGFDRRSSGPLGTSSGVPPLGGTGGSIPNYGRDRQVAPIGGDWNGRGTVPPPPTRGKWVERPISRETGEWIDPNPSASGNVYNSMTTTSGMGNMANMGGWATNTMDDRFRKDNQPLASTAQPLAPSPTAQTNSLRYDPYSTGTTAIPPQGTTTGSLMNTATMGSMGSLGGMSGMGTTMGMTNLSAMGGLAMTSYVPTYPPMYGYNGTPTTATSSGTAVTNQLSAATANTSPTSTTATSMAYSASVVSTNPYATYKYPTATPYPYDPYKMYPLQTAATSTATAATTASTPATTSTTATSENIYDSFAPDRQNLQALRSTSTSTAQSTTAQHYAV